MGVATTVLETAATVGDGSTDGERADQQSMAPTDPKEERAFVCDMLTITTMAADPNYRYGA